MNILAVLVMFSWIPIVLVFFATLPARRAAIVAFITGWLFLPYIGFPLQGLPDYTKMSATSAGVLLGTLLFGSEHLLALRPRWYDVPMAVFCACPFASSIANGLGSYDGLSAMLEQTVTWGFPYLLGRVYLGTLEGLRELAIGIVAGGLIYVPLCLIEIRMSPQFANWAYAAGTGVGDTVYGGGYRPRVFMANALEVGMWMTASSLCAVWLWSSGSWKQLWGYPAGSLTVGLVITTILCKSTGALLLLSVGLMIYLSLKRMGRSFPVLILLLTPILYMGTRGTGLWSGQEVIDILSTFLPEARIGSLKFRMDNENILAAKALEHRAFGWGGWGRARVYDEEGRDTTVIDGYWVLVLGSNGLVGLVSWITALQLPLGLLLARYPLRLWSRPAVAPAAVLSVLLGLYSIDCLSNAMINPIYIFAIGGLTGLGVAGGREDERSLDAGEEGMVEQGSGRAALDHERGSETERERREAIAAMEGASDPNPEAIRALALAYDGLARFLKDDGRIFDADAAWERSHTLWSAIAATDRGEIEVLRAWADGRNDLAWLLANTSDTSRRDPARAIALADQAIALRPDCATYWNTLGLACLRHHDADACILAIETSIRLEGGSIHDHLILSMAYHYRGDLAIARRWFASAIARMQASEATTLDVAALYQEAEALLNAPRDLAALPAPTKPLDP
jgi:tetratricopeptide (TPR) repeat protein